MRWERELKSKVKPVEWGKDSLIGGKKKKGKNRIQEASGAQYNCSPPTEQCRAVHDQWEIP